MPCGRLSDSGCRGQRANSKLREETFGCKCALRAGKCGVWETQVELTHPSPIGRELDVAWHGIGDWLGWACLRDNMNLVPLLQYPAFGLL